MLLSVDIEMISFLVWDAIQIASHQWLTFSIVYQPTINPSLFGTILAELVFSLLGRLDIQHRRFGAITLTNRKAIGLLAYLVMESDHAHSREFLLGLLWPDLPTAAAQNNLRVTWAHLQKALRTSASAEQPHLLGDRLALALQSAQRLRTGCDPFSRINRGLPSPSAR
jgi:DNA-binding SARP family transcriptional activator